MVPSLLARSLVLGVATGAATLCFAGSALAIVGGREVGIDQVPWQVGVSDVGGEATCGGAIIDAGRVLTAAHCVGDARGPITVIGSASNGDVLTPPSQVVPVASVTLHPYYRALRHPDGLHDDLAILTLARPLALGTPTAQAIPLVPVGHTIRARTPMVISGYGATGDGFMDEGSGPLRAGDLIAMGPEECPVGSADAAAVWVCTPAGDWVAKGCSGDSGSPLTTVLPGQTTPALVGIHSASSAPDCALSYHSAVNLAAPEIRAFIDGSAKPPRAPARKRAHEAVYTSRNRHVGEVLTCNPPKLAGKPKVRFVFVHQPHERQADWTMPVPRKPIKSGRSRRYTLKRRDVGKSVGCIVVASNAGGTSMFRSQGIEGANVPRPILPRRRG